MKHQTLLSLSVRILRAANVVWAQSHQHQLGEVDFSISCNSKAQEHVETGVAQLHHMMCEQARPQFEAAAAADAECAYELRLMGTNRGPIDTPDGEIPATGRRINLPAAVFADLDASSRFLETRRYYDVAEMMRHLGLDHSQ